MAFCVIFFEIFGQSNVPFVRYICNDTFLSESSYMWLHVLKHRSIHVAADLTGTKEGSTHSIRQTEVTIKKCSLKY